MNLGRKWLFFKKKNNYTYLIGWEGETSGSV